MWTAMDQYGKHPDKTRKVVLSMTVDIDDTTDFGLYETKEAAEQMISSTMQQMSLIPETKSTDTIIDDFISLHKTLQSSTPIPLLSLIAQNSFTHALDIQANLIQHALLSLFFDSLNLRKHLETLNSYLLFGNGVFVTRLHEALFEDFDDDGRSGGQPGLGLGMGLKGKNNWPPNSAKVGLVLRNILSESGVDTTGISFAYRELSEEHFNKVQNPIGTLSTKKFNTKVLKLSIFYNYYINQHSLSTQSSLHPSSIDMIVFSFFSSDYYGCNIFHTNFSVMQLHEQVTPKE
jgi:hypothetical protein